MLVTDLLVESFPDILNVEFTAGMEDELDGIEEGKEHWVAGHAPLLRALREGPRARRRSRCATSRARSGRPTSTARSAARRWSSSGAGAASSSPAAATPSARTPRTSRATRTATIVSPKAETTDEVCEKCGKPMLVRFGRFGKFLGCSGYPECKTIQPLHKPGRPASTCADVRRGRDPREALAARQDLLLLQPLSRLQVRRLGSPDAGAVSALRGALRRREDDEAAGTVRRCVREGCGWQAQVDPDDPTKLAVLPPREDGRQGRAPHGRGRGEPGPPRTARRPSRRVAAGAVAPRRRGRRWRPWPSPRRPIKATKAVPAEGEETALRDAGHRSSAAGSRARGGVAARARRDRGRPLRDAAGARRPRRTRPISSPSSSARTRSATPRSRRRSACLKDEMRRLGSLVMRVADRTRCRRARASPSTATGFAAALTRRDRAQRPGIRLDPRGGHGASPTGSTIVATGPLTSPALSERAHGRARRDAPLLLRRDRADRHRRLDRHERSPRRRRATARAATTTSTARSTATSTTRSSTRCSRPRRCRRATSSAASTSRAACRSRRWRAAAATRSRSVRCGRSGLIDPRTGRRPYAVVQLRQDDAAGTLFNMVGFQTKMTYPEQRRVFRMIPGLERAEFVRLGSLHRNTFVNAPELLHADAAAATRAARCSSPGRSSASRATSSRRRPACSRASTRRGCVGGEPLRAAADDRARLAARLRHAAGAQGLPADERQLRALPAARAAAARAREEARARRARARRPRALAASS